MNDNKTVLNDKGHCHILFNHSVDATVRDQVGNNVGMVIGSSTPQCCPPIIISSIDFCILYFNKLFHDRDSATHSCII